MTPINQEYVAAYKVQHHLNEGYNEAQIALIWNQGHAGQCSSGYNKHGVWYDSCDYQKKVLALLR